MSDSESLCDQKVIQTYIKSRKSSCVCLLQDEYRPIQVQQYFQHQRPSKSLVSAKMSHPSQVKATPTTHQQGTSAVNQIETKMNQKDNPQQHITNVHQQGVLNGEELDNTPSAQQKSRQTIKVAKDINKQNNVSQKDSNIDRQIERRNNISKKSQRPPSPSCIDVILSYITGSRSQQQLRQSQQSSANTRVHQASVEIDQEDTTTIEKLYYIKQRLIQSNYQQLPGQNQQENPLDYLAQVQLKNNKRKCKSCLLSILLFKYQLVNYYYYQQQFERALKLIDQCISMHKNITSKQYPLFNLLVYRFIIAVQLTINKNYYYFLKDSQQLQKSYNKIIETFQKDEVNQHDNNQKLFLVRDIIHYYYLEKHRQAQYEHRDQEHFKKISYSLQQELPAEFITNLENTSGNNLTIRPNQSFCPKIVNSLFSRSVRSFEQQMVKNQSKGRAAIASEVQNLNKLKEINCRDTFTLQQSLQQRKQNQLIYLWSYDQYMQVTKQIENTSKVYKIKLPYYNLDSIYISNKVGPNWMVPFKAKKYVLINRSQKNIMLKYMRGIEVCQKGSLNNEPSIHINEGKTTIFDLQYLQSKANPYCPPSYVPSITKSSVPTYSSRFEDVCGLPNIGNTCYMNSALQCLNNSTSFQKALENQMNQRIANYGSVGRLAYTYLKLLSETKIHEQKRKGLNQIKRIVSQSNPIFEGHQQNDSLQFFNTFIIILRQELNNSKNEKLKTALQQRWDDGRLLAATVEKDQSRFKSIIEQNFTGRYKTVYTCGQCNQDYRLFEKFNVHYVPLPPPDQYWRRSQPYDLRQCLKDAEEPDQLLNENAMTCDSCEQRNRTSKKTMRVIKIYQPNKILVIGLKRFHDGQKNDRPVKVPLTLSIEEVVPNGYYKKQYKDKRYVLYGAILHYGSLTGGHYTSICRDKQGQWRDYSDSHVSEIRKPQCRSLQNAYGLFYELEDINESESNQRVRNSAIKTSFDRQQNSRRQGYC